MIDVCVSISIREQKADMHVSMRIDRSLEDLSTLSPDHCLFMILLHKHANSATTEDGYHWFSQSIHASIS